MPEKRSLWGAIVDSTLRLRPREINKGECWDLGMGVGMLIGYGFMHDGDGKQ